MTQSRARLLFTIAAMYNIIAAAIALSLPEFHLQEFFGLGVVADSIVARMNTEAVWVTVLIFGLGYGLVARDPSRNHGIVKLAIVGKVYFGLTWIFAFARGDVTPLALVGAIGDIIFALIFVAFLKTFNATRKKVDPQA